MGFCRVSCIHAFQGCSLTEDPRILQRRGTDFEELHTCAFVRVHGREEDLLAIYWWLVGNWETYY